MFVFCVCESGELPLSCPNSQATSRLEQELTQASTCCHFWMVGEIAQEHNYTHTSLVLEFRVFQMEVLAF